MISVIKNSSGFIIAYAEWNVVNKFGGLDKDGEYCHIHELWIHEFFEGFGIIKEIIYLIDTHKFMKKVKWVYWENLKHNERKTPSYRRERLAKIGEKYGK